MSWRVDCSPVRVLETVRVCRMFILFGLGLGLGEIRRAVKSNRGLREIRLRWLPSRS